MSAVPAVAPVEAEYRTRARTLASHAREQWEHSARSDLKSLVDEVQCALVEEANHELRQVLFQLSAQLELSLFRLNGNRTDTSPEAKHIERLLAATRRATAIVDTYLDRGEAAKLVIRLAPARFDLGEALLDALRWNGFLNNADVHIQPADIEGDRDRLVPAIVHIVARLLDGAGPADRLRVVVQPSQDHVDGFIGIAGTPLDPTLLLAEFDAPSLVEDMQIDMPYTRAVIERHGGTLYIATDRDGADGYAFVLPTTLAPEA